MLTTITRYALKNLFVITAIIATSSLTGMYREEAHAIISARVVTPSQIRKKRTGTDIQRPIMQQHNMISARPEQTTQLQRLRQVAETCCTIQ